MFRLIGKPLSLKIPLLVGVGEMILGLDPRILLIVKFYYSIRGLLMYL